MILTDREIDQLIRDILSGVGDQCPTKRSELYNKMEMIFRNVNPFTCEKDLQPYIKSDNKLLGEGNFGEVKEYSVIKTPGCDIRVALKNSRYQTYEELIYEVSTCTSVTQLVVTNTIPNFVMTFKYGLCSIDNEKNEKGNNYFYLVQELGDMTFDDIRESLNVNQIVSLFVQILMSIVALQRYTGMAHNDLYPRNILIKLGSEENIKYILDKQEYGINTYGAIALITDFGHAWPLNKPNSFKLRESKEFTGYPLPVIHNVFLIDVSNYERDLVNILNIFADITPKGDVKNYMIEWLNELAKEPIGSTDGLVKNINTKLPAIVKNSPKTFDNVYNLTLSPSVKSNLDKNYLEIKERFEGYSKSLLDNYNQEIRNVKGKEEMIRIYERVTERHPQIKFPYEYKPLSPRPAVPLSQQLRGILGGAFPQS